MGITKGRKGLIARTVLKLTEYCYLVSTIQLVKY